MSRVNSTQTQPTTALALDAAALYWAVLEAPPQVRGLAALLRGGADEEALRYAFETWLPQPIDEVECRFVRAPSDDHAIARVVACGIPRDRLLALLDEAESAGRAIESAAPTHMPEVVAKRLLPEADLDGLASALEFRAGGCESPRVTRRRRRTHLTLAASAALATGLVSAGMFRGAAALLTESAQARSAADVLAASALGEAEGAALGAGLSSLRLTGELAALERTRDRSADLLLAADRGATLLTLLAAWPDAIPTRVDQVHAEQEALTIRGEVRDAGDFERLALALSELLAAAGWAEQTKSGSKSRDAFSFTLAFKPGPVRAAPPGTEPPEPTPGAPGTPGASGPTAISAAPPVPLPEGAP